MNDIFPPRVLMSIALEVAQEAIEDFQMRRLSPVDIALEFRHIGSKFATWENLLPTLAARWVEARSQMVGLT